MANCRKCDGVGCESCYGTGLSNQMMMTLEKWINDEDVEVIGTPSQLAKITVKLMNQQV